MAVEQAYKTEEEDMIFHVMFKDPGALWEAIRNQPESVQDDLKEFTEKWLKWGEYVKLEFNVDEGSCKVCTVKE